MPVKKTLFSIITFLIVMSRLLFAQDELITSSSTLGGYGELHYNYVKPENEPASKMMDFHRFVLFYGHRWNDSWSFKAEVELEHNFVSDGEGELELEQAYIDYHYSDWLGFQAGVLLPSIGLLNEFHEPPLFFSVERPDYAKNIIPTTWFGNGIALYGNYENFDFKVIVMEGLDADGISPKSGIRNARMKGFKSDAEYFLYNFRLNYLGIDGLRTGASVTFNKAKGDSTYNSIALFEFHAKYHANNIHAVFEYGNINYSEGDLLQSIGYYFDFGYNVASFFETDIKVYPFVRYTNYNTAASTKSGGDSEKKYHNEKLMFGIAVYPIEQVVIKADYAVNIVELNDTKTTLFNIGVGYMF